MTDLQRNMRTLVICFVIALGGLVPLRFLAEGQNLGIGETVLGETTDQVEAVTPAEEEAVVEPGCIAEEELGPVIDGLNQRIIEGGLTEEETAQIYQTMEQLEAEKCKISE